MIEFLNSFDTSAFLFLNGLHSPWLNPVMVKVSGQLLWFPVFGIFSYLAYKQLGLRNALVFALFVFLVMVAADVTSSQILKNFFMRMRPCRQPEILALMNQFGQKCGGRFGFVSSHASNTFAPIIFIIGVIKLSRMSVMLTLLFPILVSYSRIYLGVHFPGDVIGGALIGVAWGIFFVWAYRNLQGASRTSSQA